MPLTQRTICLIASGVAQPIVSTMPIESGGEVSIIALHRLLRSSGNARVVSYGKNRACRPFSFA